MRELNRSAPPGKKLAALAVLLPGCDGGTLTLPDFALDADTNVVVDAASDVVIPESDAALPDAAKGFCGGRTAALCEDFESGTLAQLPTTEALPAGNSATIVESTKSPHVLRAFSTASGQGAYARPAKFVAVATSKFRFGCDISIAKAATTSPVETCAAWVDIAGKGRHIFLVSRQADGTLLVRDSYTPEGAGQAPKQQASATKLALNAWARAEIEVDLTGNAPNAKLRIDGGAPTMLTLDPASGGEGQLIVKVGLNYVNNPDVPVEVFVDNVLVELL